MQSIATLEGVSSTRKPIRSRTAKQNNGDNILLYYRDINFCASGYFAFDASEDVIHYDPVELTTNQGKLALLHEISHATLGHFNYESDFELLVMEAQAWHLTQQLCDKFGVSVDSVYIRDCIESYDTWLLQRGSCPKCSNLCLPKKTGAFECFLCGCCWQASSSPSERITISLVQNIS